MDIFYSLNIDLFSELAFQNAPFIIQFDFHILFRRYIQILKRDEFRLVHR